MYRWCYTTSITWVLLPLYHSGRLLSRWWCCYWQGHPAQLIWQPPARLMSIHARGSCLPARKAGKAVLTRECSHGVLSIIPTLHYVMFCENFTTAWGSHSHFVVWLLQPFHGHQEAPQPVFMSYCPLEKLKLAGAKVPIFSGHSDRGASTSATAGVGVTLNEIMQATDWSTESLFQRFYYISPPMMCHMVGKCCHL